MKKRMFLFLLSSFSLQIMTEGGDVIKLQFDQSSGDGDGRETAGEREKGGKKPSWFSRFFSRSKPASAKPGQDSNGETTLRARNPVGVGESQGSVSVAVNEQNAASRLLTNAEKKAIVQEVNERGFRSWFKRKPKFKTTPPALTDVQLKLYQDLVARFEKDPNSNFTSYVKNTDLNFDITEADRPVIFQIANSAREIAIFEHRATRGLSPTVKSVVTSYLNGEGLLEGETEGKSYLTTDSVSEYKQRIELAVRVAKRLANLIQKDPSLLANDVLLENFNKGLSQGSNEQKLMNDIAQRMLKTDEAFRKFSTIRVD